MPTKKNAISFIESFKNYNIKEKIKFEENPIDKNNTNNNIPSKGRLLKDIIINIEKENNLNNENTNEEWL